MKAFTRQDAGKLHLSCDCKIYTGGAYEFTTIGELIKRMEILEKEVMELKEHDRE
jgi:hypothetical protein